MRAVETLSRLYKRIVSQEKESLSPEVTSGFFFFSMRSIVHLYVNVPLQIPSSAAISRLDVSNMYDECAVFPL